MVMIPDYELAVAWPAHPSNYGYGGQQNHPKGFCIHTPEEPADPHGGTPLHFAKPNVGASTHYFVTHAGGVYQLVPEREGAWANAVQGKPYPAWADPNVNLNLQSLSVEVEGYASNIDQTMPLDSPQWNSLVALVVSRCRRYHIPFSRQRVFGHYEVSNLRTCPGQLPLEELVAWGQRYQQQEWEAAVGKAVANFTMLAFTGRWQDLANALAAIGIRPR